MSRIPSEPDITPTSIYNPMTEDFTTTYANEDNEPIPYTCPAQEISTFPAYIANKIKKNLAQVIVFKRGVKTNYEDDYNEVLKEISV